MELKKEIRAVITTVEDTDERMVLKISLCSQLYLGADRK